MIFPYSDWMQTFLNYVLYRSWTIDLSDSEQSNAIPTAPQWLNYKGLKLYYKELVESLSLFSEK